MSKLHELSQLGQSIWYDYIRRSFITSGEFQELIDKGLKGVTSNPSIFEKAIAGSADYDDDLRQLVKEDKSVDKIYEVLALKDISLAADLLRPVYDKTNGLDGYVSLEVSPLLAHDTQKTISEAKRLFEALHLWEPDRASYEERLEELKRLQRQANLGFFLRPRTFFDYLGRARSIPDLLEYAKGAWELVRASRVKRTGAGDPHM